MRHALMPGGVLVTRWAHNPEIGSSILPPAKTEATMEALLDALRVAHRHFKMLHAPGIAWAIKQEINAVEEGKRGKLGEGTLCSRPDGSAVRVEASPEEPEQTSPVPDIPSS